VLKYQKDSSETKLNNFESLLRDKKIKNYSNNKKQIVVEWCDRTNLQQFKNLWFWMGNGLI